MKKILVTNNYIIIRYAIKMLRIFLLHAFFSSRDNKHGKKRESSPYTVPHTLEPFYPKVHKDGYGVY